MNLKRKLNNNAVLVLFGLIIIIAAFAFLYPKKTRQNNTSTEAESKTLKEIRSEELSPDGLNKIISYHLVFDLSFQRGYIEEYVDNNIIISVRDMKNGKENYLFTGGRIGEPKWLGNEHVFFTSYCGSSCQGLYLVNVLNKETKQGVLSYMAFEENKPTYTHLKDWFGREFKFDGIVDEIRSETLGGKVYLIFYMRNDEQKFIGKKAFLFTGKALEE